MHSLQMYFPSLSKTKELIKICEGFYDENTKFLIYKGSSVMEEISGIDAQIYNEKNRNYIFFNLKNQREER